VELCEREVGGFEGEELALRPDGSGEAECVRTDVRADVEGDVAGFDELAKRGCGGFFEAPEEIDGEVDSFVQVEGPAGSAATNDGVIALANGTAREGDRTIGESCEGDFGLGGQHGGFS